VLNEILGLHSKPKAMVHPHHKPTGPKKKKKRRRSIHTSFQANPTSHGYVELFPRGKVARFWM